ncbi:fungal specific transcription factor domain-containing protein [Stagonosporopsis vannaccii]|nr:fungal specific transcription factor domain-containing protein [Stagonosporopsis vannaccii]
MDRGCFKKRVFTRLFPESQAVDLMRLTIEEVQLHGVFLTKENALNQLAEQYSAGLDDSSSDSCRWATLCSFLGTCTLHRAASGYVAAMSSVAWAFFKNAFAVYSELVIQGPKLAACEALLAMISFMLRTADACVAARLTATAVQSVHMLGLHQREHYVDLDADMAERHKSVFWVTYVVNADLAHRYGLPSLLGVEDVDIDFPGHTNHHDLRYMDRADDLLQPPQARLLRLRAIIAVTQLRIHRLLQQLISLRGTKRKRSDMQEAIVTIDEELEVWKNSMPINIQPGSRLHGSPLLEMPVAMLHYIYFSCMSKLSMAVILLAHPTTSSPVSQEILPIEVCTTCVSSKPAKARCVMAARGILDVLFRLQPQPFSHLWQTLCFPLSAILILMSEVLAHPTSASAETDTNLIYEFVRYLQRSQKEGNDVRKLLDGCKKFHAIATCALKAAQHAQQTDTSEQPVGDKLTPLKIQLLQSRFTKVADWLQLAQGLLSDMPALRNKAREVFRDIIEPDLMDETYGDFVPDFLKSHNYNFSFST